MVFGFAHGNHGGNVESVYAVPVGTQDVHGYPGGAADADIKERGECNLYSCGGDAKEEHPIIRAAEGHVNGTDTHNN